jgi:hypothetical protein
MFLCVLRATSRGDDALNAVDIKLAVAACARLRNPVGELLYPERGDDGSERTEDPVDIRLTVAAGAPSPNQVGELLYPERRDDGTERMEERANRGEEESVPRGKYSVTSSSKSRGGICGQLNDTDERRPLPRKPGTRNGRCNVVRLEPPGTPRAIRFDEPRFIRSSDAAGLSASLGNLSSTENRLVEIQSKLFALTGLQRS